MALKPPVSFCKRMWPSALAVPSYGAMALKPLWMVAIRDVNITCSPLLQGDGPETIDTARIVPNYNLLQSPPTGRWP